MTTLTSDLAERLARIALGHVTREYPNILVQVLGAPGETAEPRVLHPIFFGSYDWHSCVHGHWLLARLLRRFPDLPEASAIGAHFDAAFTAEKVAGELAYLERPGSGGFERPYGWAWLLALAAELRRGEGDARGWELALRPLAEAFAERFAAFLPKADYPVRAGVHSNTAFALALAHDYALAADDEGLERLIRTKAQAWYGADADCQAWEPSGDDFLSPALMEAELMHRLLVARGVSGLVRPLPAACRRARAGHAVHAGPGGATAATARSPISTASNLSRAWCWRGIASALAPEDPTHATRAPGGREVHLSASLPHVAGDYMGEHWLASFALLATGRRPRRP